MLNNTTGIKAGIGSMVKVGCAFRSGHGFSGGSYAPDEFTGTLGVVTSVDGEDCYVEAGAREFWVNRSRLTVVR